MAKTAQAVTSESLLVIKKKAVLDFLEGSVLSVGDKEVKFLLGEDEIRNGKITVKFLRSGDDQLTIDRNQAGDWIRSYIDSI